MSGDSQDSPRRRFAPAQVLHAAVCLLLAAAFLVVVALELPPRSRFVPFLTHHATDNYLRVMLQREHATESLLQSFAALPPGPLAAYYEAENSEAALMGFIVSYLAWPRPVQLIAVDAATGQAKEEKTSATQFAGAYFCLVNPPAGAEPVVRLGQGMVMVPAVAPRSAAP